LGVILHTADGGETWTLQREDTSVDQPLFTVYFTDRQNGLAAGLWSLMLATHDGGQTWVQVAVAPPTGSTKADKNLYQIFSTRQGALLVAAEQGYVYRSSDGGKSWAASESGSPGSFWTGLVLLGQHGPRRELHTQPARGQAFAHRGDDQRERPADHAVRARRCRRRLNGGIIRPKDPFQRLPELRCTKF
jgi:photosystem II stability/assembly factor-like uncharacterized protein